MREDHTLSYGNAPAKTESKGIEATVQKRTILLLEFVAHQAQERLPRRLIFLRPD